MSEWTVQARDKASGEPTLVQIVLEDVRVAVQRRRGQPGWQVTCLAAEVRGMPIYPGVPGATVREKALNLVADVVRRRADRLMKTLADMSGTGPAPADAGDAWEGQAP